MYIGVAIIITTIIESLENFRVMFNMSSSPPVTSLSSLSARIIIQLHSSIFINVKITERNINAIIRVSNYEFNS